MRPPCRPQTFRGGRWWLAWGCTTGVGHVRQPCDALVELRCQCSVASKVSLVQMGHQRLPRRSPPRVHGPQVDPRIHQQLGRVTGLGIVKRGGAMVVPGRRLQTRGQQRTDGCGVQCPVQQAAALRTLDLIAGTRHQQHPQAFGVDVSQGVECQCAPVGPCAIHARACLYRLPNLGRATGQHRCHQRVVGGAGRLWRWNGAGGLHGRQFGGIVAPWTRERKDDCMDRRFGGFGSAALKRRCVGVIPLYLGSVTDQPAGSRCRCARGL